jgi:hypothetical protein
VRKILLHSFLFEGEVAWQETFIVPFSVPPVSQKGKKNLQVLSKNNTFYRFNLNKQF